MVIASLFVSLRLHASGSLKEKRSVVQSVKRRVAHRFNVAVAEVGRHDDPRTAELGVASVSRDRRGAVGEVEAVGRFLDGDGRFDVVQREIETY